MGVAYERLLERPLPFLRARILVEARKTAPAAERPTVSSTRNKAA
jgi:hypothetical protein